MHATLPHIHSLMCALQPSLAQNAAPTQRSCQHQLRGANSGIRSKAMLQAGSMARPVNLYRAIARKRRAAVAAAGTHHLQARLAILRTLLADALRVDHFINPETLKVVPPIPE